MYTTIIHPLRKKLGLSVKEYIILDAFYLNSYLKGKKVNSREIADLFDFTNSSVDYAIKKLIKTGYLQKNKENKIITTTELTKLLFLKN
jgi:DNA-binding MarR family transcriptional regulator